MASSGQQTVKQPVNGGVSFWYRSIGLPSRVRRFPATSKPTCASSVPGSPDSGPPTT